MLHEGKTGGFSRTSGHSLSRACAGVPGLTHETSSSMTRTCEPFVAARKRSAGGRRVTVAWVLVLLLLVPLRAEGQYLDPGAASIIVQAVVATVVAVGAVVKLYWSRISGLFSRLRRPAKEQ